MGLVVAVSLPQPVAAIRTEFLCVTVASVERGPLPNKADIDIILKLTFQRTRALDIYQGHVGVVLRRSTSTRTRTWLPRNWGILQNMYNQLLL